MAAVERNIHVQQGDDYVLTLRFWVDSAHTVPRDVTGRTFRSQLRARKDPDSPLLAEFTVDATQAAVGEVTFTLTDAETTTLRRDCHWDLEQEVGGLITTLFAGECVVERQVTVPAP